jgi:hypothetical protein
MIRKIVREEVGRTLKTEARQIVLGVIGEAALQGMTSKAPAAPVQESARPGSEVVRQLTRRSAPVPEPVQTRQAPRKGPLFEGPMAELFADVAPLQESIAEAAPEVNIAALDIDPNVMRRLAFGKGR